jgi:outer membrane protein assembly factor BamB
VHDGRVYALGSEGALRCLDAGTGKTIWEKSLTKTYKTTAPTWGYAAHPVIFKHMVLTLAGGEGSACVALDAATGVEKWRTGFAKQVGYASPEFLEINGHPRAFFWTGDNLNLIDPLSGKVLWQKQYAIRYGVSIAQPRAVENHVLLSNFWRGTVLLNMESDTPVSIYESEQESDTRTTHLNALMTTPVIIGDFAYGVCSYGQLRCLNWKTGERRWATLDHLGGKELRWGTAFLTRIGQSHRFLIFNELGELLLASLTPDGYTELSRQRLVEPDCPDVKERKLVWTHPAYANGACLVRNCSRVVSVRISP